MIKCDVVPVGQVASAAVFKNSKFLITWHGLNHCVECQCGSCRRWMLGIVTNDILC